MLELGLIDSQLKPYKPPGYIDWRKLGVIEKAITTLNSEVAEGRITCCAFFGKRRNVTVPELVRFYPEKIDSYCSGRIVSELSFTTSHYVGQACVRVTDETVKIHICPRFAKPIWNHLLQCASRVYIPDRFISSGLSTGDDTEWLLLLMWRNAFERAMRKASVPKAYVSRRQNLRFFRGRLDVTQHLKANLADQSRMFCAYTPLSCDNTINRAIRSVYRVLAASNIPAKMCASISEHDNRLATLGVDNVGVTIQDIDSIRYTQMTEVYRPVMALSKVILRGYGAGEFGGEGVGPSYFVDVAEIWENYLLSVMQRYLPDFTFVSPNEASESVWLLKTARPVRPDFLVYDSNCRLIAVMDAKYKRYERIGCYEKEPYAVSREDLYQMATYMFRFGNKTLPLAGIFISPYNVGDEDMLEVMETPGHFMTVCNLSLEEFDCKMETSEDSKVFKTRLQKLEEDFASRLKQCLNKVVALYD